MFETELKFQVPAGSLAAVRRELATSTARSIVLRARCFDTPDRRLARAGLALRLRQEGGQWVQALKGSGPDALRRLEYEVPLDDQGDHRPSIDIGRHRGITAEAAIAAALGHDAAPLALVFETDVRRTLRRVRSGGAVTEVALDLGEVVAGDRREPVRGIEFELVRGGMDGMLTLAARWARRVRDRVAVGPPCRADPASPACPRETCRDPDRVARRCRCQPSRAPGGGALTGAAGAVAKTPRRPPPRGAGGGPSRLQRVAVAQACPQDTPVESKLFPSLGSSRPALAGVRVNTLGPHGRGADSFQPGKTFDCTASGRAGGVVQSCSCRPLEFVWKLS